MAREMTDEEKKEYDLLTANMEQMQFRLDELMAGPAVYGYARVSTYGQAAHGNSLEEQKGSCVRQGRKRSSPMFLLARRQSVRSCRNWSAALKTETR